MLNNLKKELEKLKDPKQAKILSGFFKTGKDQYGEGDVFLGIKVPIQRKVAARYRDLSLKSLQELLNSKIHEHRLIALVIMISQYERGNEKIFNFYLKNTKNINNWDLVDISAPKIVGNYLLDKERGILYDLVRSENLWERRIAIISCFTFIRNNEFKDVLKISEILLNDEHDLIHKAVGWMLREVGKRNKKVLEGFLEKNKKDMPRTMLRYSIEKFSKEKREYYMN